MSSIENVRRYQSIRELIAKDPKFKGNLAAFARFIGKDPSYCRRSLGDNPTSKVSARFARQIESELGLEYLSLDGGKSYNSVELPEGYVHANVPLLNYRRFKEIGRQLIEDPLKAEAFAVPTIPAFIKSKRSSYLAVLLRDDYMIDGTLFTNGKMIAIMRTIKKGFRARIGRIVIATNPALFNEPIIGRYSFKGEDHWIDTLEPEPKRLLLHENFLTIIGEVHTTYRHQFDLDL